MCIPILVTTLPGWLSGTEHLPHTPGAVRDEFILSFAYFKTNYFYKTALNSETQWVCLLKKKDQNMGIHAVAHSPVSL